MLKFPAMHSSRSFRIIVIAAVVAYLSSPCLLANHPSPFSVVGGELRLGVDDPATLPAQNPTTVENTRSGETEKDAHKIYQADRDGVSMPSCYYMPNPPYTKEAIEAQFVGVVTAEAIVFKSGKLDQIRILKSPGMGLDKSTVSTLKTWKCNPAKLEGKPVSARATFELNFRLPPPR